MTELAIVEKIIQYLRNKKAECCFSRVKQVELFYGAGGALDQEGLQFWFNIMAEAVEWKGARITLARAPVGMNGVYISGLEVK